MATENVRSSFLVVGDLNGRHQEWVLQPRTVMMVQAFDIARVSGCDLLFSAQPMHEVEPTNLVEPRGALDVGR